MEPAQVEPIAISYMRDVSEHIAADRLYYRTTLFFKLDIVLGILFIAVGGYWCYRTGIEAFTICLLIGGLVILLKDYWMRALLVKRAFKANPKLLEPIKLLFNDDGIQMVTPSVFSDLKWNFYTRFVETEKFWVLHAGGSTFSVIPKRAFKSEQQLADFAKLVRAKISPSA